MSALSFPSLTSDSSSLSRGSDFDELTNERLIRTSLTTNPTASIPLPPRDPESSEIRQLRSRVSKLEQDKFILGDYAAELQSCIRRLESERMEHQDLINNIQELELVGQVESSPSAVVSSSLSRPNSPTNNSHSIPPNHPSLHRPSSSLSAATSTAAKRALAHSSSRGTPGPSSSQPNLPFSSKIKLVPKRSSRVEPSEVFISPQPEPSVGRRNCEYESMTPTRRRLQAMYGLFSSESSPPLGEGDHVQTELKSHKPDGPLCARSIRVPYSKRIPQDNARDQETKRPTFTSKLDSIILTSKLFPLSSRSKTSPSPVSPDHRTPTSHTAVIPLVCATTSSTPHGGNIVLNSPPNKNVKVQLPRQGHNLLSQSLGLEENQHSHLNSKSTDRKLAPRTRGRVSFSERLFSSPSGRGDETDMDIEQSGRMWGSWSKESRPPPLSFIDEKLAPSPPSSPLSRISRDSDDQRRGKRTSLAPGCLRSLVPGSGDRDKDGHVPRRSHSESRRPDPVSRSNSGRSTTNSRPPEDGEHGANMRSKGDRKRITPSRVGSPMPQSRLPELQGGAELERTNSMRSTGKWGHRGRQFSAELTRRRTIHPMFSFERPGTAEVASTSSSRRCDAADNGAMGDEPRGVVDKSRRLPHGIASPSPLLTRLPSHEPDASQSQATHTQGYSEASGHSGGTGLSRPDPGPAGKTSLMRTRLGIQSHGAFAFEPAAAVVCSPRSTSAVGTDGVRGVKATGGSLSKRKGITLVRSLTDTHARDQESSKSGGRNVNKATKELEYLEFCKELKVVLGDGEDWSLFKKYVRRFDLEVLSAEVLVQRVKKLLDERRTVDSATRLRLYERFVKAVHDMNE